MAEVITALSLLGTETANTTNFDRIGVPQTMNGGLAIATSLPVNAGKLTGINLKAGTNKFFYSLVSNSKKRTLIGVLAGSGLLVVLILVGFFVLKSNSKEEKSSPTKEKTVLAEKKENPVQGKEVLKKEETKIKADPVYPSKPLPGGEVTAVQKSVAKSLQKEVEEDLGKGIKLDMVLIPSGKFIMGSPANGLGQASDKKGYEVTLTTPYYMGKYEVTQEQWEAVMGNKFTLKKGAKLPVAVVSWNDCQEFIKKLNASTKGGYRLPTEAEWEYACRAGTTTAYSFGDKITPQDANYGDSKLMETVAVGSYKPNAFGLYDMHGNVREWCEDWYEDYPAQSVTDPKGPVQGKNHVVRGGSFDDQGLRADSSSRDNLPDNRFNMVGFRLARTK